MDLLKDNIRQVYFRYLASAFGGTLISSIYSTVDMAVVGQYHGPHGSAALAVVAPVWSVISGLGLLCGIGGGVLFSHARGRRDGEENRWFTVAVAMGMLLGLIAWAALLLFEEPILRFFGASDEILPLAMAYLRPVRLVLPLFLLGQLLASFLRNDGAPALATAAVLAGGIFNIFGDLFFTFGLDLGAYGAGLATAIGCVISLLVELTHFLRRKNTLRFCRPDEVAFRMGRIASAGFSAFFLDLAIGILTVLFNRQIMAYLGDDALAVYGVMMNVGALSQCFAYGVGQAAQPVLSVNHGAGESERVRRTVRLALCSAAVLGLLWTGLCLCAPQGVLKLFMSPTEAVLQMGPPVVRVYALSFLFLGGNVVTTYCLQSVLQPRRALVVSLLRGLGLSGALILLLPRISPQALWLAMPLAELGTFAYAAFALSKTMKRDDGARS